MGNDLIVNAETSGGLLTLDQIETLKQAGVIPNGTPSEQIAVFAHICREQGLSPFSREIYLVGYGGKYTPITGINGLRKIADRAQNFAGCDNPQYDLDANGGFKTAAMFKQGELPKTCTVTVYKVVGGIRCPFTATVVFSEFNNARNPKWKEMPFQMIAKVAESHAIRKGWAISGVYTDEELATISENVEPSHYDKKLPELTPQSPQWDAVIKKLQAGVSIDKVKEHFSMSADVEKVLFDLQKPANDE